MYAEATATGSRDNRVVSISMPVGRWRTRRTSPVQRSRNRYLDNLLPSTYNPAFRSAASQDGHNPSEVFDVGASRLYRPDLRVPVERDHGFRWKMIAQSGGT